MNVTVNNNPSPVITSNGAVTFCQGGNVVLSSNMTSGNTWSTNATTQSITVNSSGSYFVNVVDANGCAGTSNTISVTVNPNNVPSVTASGPTTFCQGGSVVLVSSIANNITWSTGATTQSITVNTPGTYTVTENSSCGGTSQAVTVTVNSNPAPVVTSGGPTTFCQGNNVVLTSSIANGNTWSNSATSQSITVTTSGNYSVSVTDANGCSGSSNSIAVTVNPNSTPSITASGQTTFCQGGSVVLMSSIPGNNTWSTGATTQSITVNTSGTYTVTDNSGCGGTSQPVTVTVNSNPSPSVTSGGQTTFCQGGSVTLTCSPQGSYSWSNGSTTNSINVTSSGSYSVVLTDANGCTGTSQVTQVNVMPNPVISMSNLSPVCVGDAPFALTNASPTGGTYSGTGVNANTFSPSVAGVGTYTITYVYTNSGGCSDTAQAIITVNGQQNATITSAGPFCETDGPVTLTAANGGGTWSGSGMSNGTFDPASAGAGTWPVIYTIPGTCGDSDTLMITVYAQPVADAGNDVTIMIGESASLTATGGGSYTWSPQGGLSCSVCPSPVATPTVTTTYYVTVTNANGCTSIDSITVTVEVLDGELFVPNMFSPNEDGLNDLLFVFGNNIVQLDFAVYNRWGQKVFESNAMQNGWDGTFNGKKLDPAVFVYYVRAVYDTGRIETKSGNVTLVK